jgi:hypothetical protein
MKTRWTLEKLKNPGLWKGKLGEVIGDFTPELAEGLLIDRITADDPGEQEKTQEEIERQEKAQKEIEHEVIKRQKLGRSFDDLLLLGFILELESKGLRPTTARLAQRLGISRDTLYQKYVNTGALAEAQRRAYAYLSLDVKAVRSRREIE